jgi:hypothetical protein
MGKFVPDVDIDFADREVALDGLTHIPAARYEKDSLKKHIVGVYFQSIPQDPVTGLASIEYKEAEERGYFKMDFLNLHIYKQVKSEAHLNDLIAREPLWAMLEDEAIVNQLFHLSDHFEVVNTMRPQNIEQLAMVLAMIRPAKRHLVGRSWSEVEADVWVVNDDEGYAFKKAHSFSYAMVIVVQMNLLLEQAMGLDVSEA